MPYLVNGQVVWEEVIRQENAFRTVDITDPTFVAAPFYGKLRYGGGKLGLYQFWNTCATEGFTPTAPIGPTNTGNSQYEFYNYSNNPPGLPALQPNARELGNQYFDTANPPNRTAEADLYYQNYMNTGTVHGINVQNELYQLQPNGGTPNPQVVAAISAAFKNYITYLTCHKLLTGTDGKLCSDQTGPCGYYVNA